MPTKRTTRKPATARKPVQPKLPPINFSEVYLRGAAFGQDIKQLIANFMASKAEKQATTAVMRMIRQYYQQADQIQQLITDRNQLQEKLNNANTHLRLLTEEISAVQSLEKQYTDRKANLVALTGDVLKTMPKQIRHGQDDDDFDHDYPDFE